MLADADGTQCAADSDVVHGVTLRSAAAPQLECHFATTSRLLQSKAMGVPSKAMGVAAIIGALTSQSPSPLRPTILRGVRACPR
jgi:hypothetical protein